MPGYLIRSLSPQHDSMIISYIGVKFGKVDGCHGMSVINRGLEFTFHVFDKNSFGIESQLGSDVS